MFTMNGWNYLSNSKMILIIRGKNLRDPFNNGWLLSFKII